MKDITPAQEFFFHTLIGYLFLIFGGVLGLHRFYFGRWISGILYILTGGFCMIGVIIDIAMIPGWAEEKIL